MHCSPLKSSGILAREETSYTRFSTNISVLSRRGWAPSRADIHGKRGVSWIPWNSAESPSPRSEIVCLARDKSRTRQVPTNKKKQRKNGEISAKVPEDLPKYRSLRHKTNHTLNFGSIRMGTCIQKYGCKQLVSAVDALMPKMGIYEKFDVLTAIANLRILENEFIFLVMLII